MKTMKFKTNLKCGGCIAAITPVMNETNGIEKWNVDLSTPDRVLTVESDSVSESDVVAKIQTAGYKIEVLKS